MRAWQSETQKKKRLFRAELEDSKSGDRSRWEEGRRRRGESVLHNLQIMLTLALRVDLLLERFAAQKKSRDDAEGSRDLLQNSTIFSHKC